MRSRSSTSPPRSSVKTCPVTSASTPGEILDFFAYVKSLKQIEKPDYTKINRMFRDLLSASLNHSNTLRYDWVEKALSSIENKKAKKKGAVNSGSEIMMEAKEDPKEPKLGAIDLDGDINFRVNNPDDHGDSDDDESNVDEESAQEFPNKMSDPKELTTKRLEQGYTYSLIKNRTGLGP